MNRSILHSSSETHQSIGTTHAINEGIDNNIDALINNPHITQHKSVYLEVFEERLNSMITNQQFSMLIIDANGGFDVESVYNEKSNVQMMNQIYLNKDILYSKMGAYNAGMSSYISIGEEVYIASFYNSQWKILKIERIPHSLWYGSDIQAETNDGYNYQYHKISDITKILTNEQLSKMNFHTRLNDIQTNGGTLIFIRNITPDADEFNNNQINLDDLVHYYKFNLGYTYSNFLAENINILVNHSQTEPISPFVFGENSHLIEAFLTEEIPLSEFCKIKPDLINTLWDLYGHLFSSIEEMLQEKLTITLYAIDNKKFKTIYKKVPNNIIHPNKKWSGLYLERNKKIIGKPLKVPDVFVEHDRFNAFRGLVSFSPIFDQIFGIGANKDRYQVTNTFLSIFKDLLIQKGILEENKKFIEKYLKKFIDETFNAISQTDRRQILNDKIQSLESLRQNALSNNINTDSISLDFDINDTEITEEIYNDTIKKLKSIENKINANIKLKENHVNSDTLKLIARERASITNRLALYLGDDEDDPKNPLNYLYAPQNEGELYGLLKEAMLLIPNSIPFIPLDYKDSNGLDSIGYIANEDDYDFFNIKERKALQPNISDLEGNSSFIEYKYTISNNQSMGHSLALVSYIVCWKSDNDVTSISANDGLYTITSDGDRTFYECAPPIYGGPSKKVIILSLKEIIEESLEKKFCTIANLFEDIF